MLNGSLLKILRTATRAIHLLQTLYRLIKNATKKKPPKPQSSDSHPTDENGK